MRVRWEYRPGSELFVVYSEARDTDVLDRSTELQNRGLTVKQDGTSATNIPSSSCSTKTRYFIDASWTKDLHNPILNGFRVMSDRADPQDALNLPQAVRIAR